MLTIKSENSQEIYYATECSAGFDVRSNEDCVIAAGAYYAVASGLYIIDHASEVQVNYGTKSIRTIPELQIRPRSGLAAKHGITVLNAPGTIDADYRGEIKIILINHSKQAFEIKKHDRIAQAVCALCLRVPGINVQQTERGNGGFGSTGHE